MLEIMVKVMPIIKNFCHQDSPMDSTVDLVKKAGELLGSFQRRHLILTQPFGTQNFLNV